MSQHPDLTPEILEELRTSLLNKQKDLELRLTDIQQAEAVDPSSLDDADIDAPGDEGDSSVDLQDHDDSQELAFELQAHLAEVQHALTKFDNDTYGICEGCDKPIPLARLRILPEARYDVQHQAEVEERQSPR